MLRIKASERALNHCADLARIAGGSYEMMEFCLKEESAAEQKLAAPTETPAAETSGLPVYDSQAYCRSIGNTAGGSSEIELFCRQSEDTAKKNLAQMKVSDRAMKYCGQIGQAAGGSYEMLEFCLKEEMAAEKQLQ